MTGRADHLVIGGGFYGCCLALHLRSMGQAVTLAEQGGKLLDRASRVNQARIHTGFHYPRSALTAVKSLVLCKRFAQDFPRAVVDDFTMLYAVPKRRSRVSAKRFHDMFRNLGAPIRPAGPERSALFDPDTVDRVFECREAAYDYRILREDLEERLHASGVDMRLNTRVERLETDAAGVRAELSDGSGLATRFAFNVTYSGINGVLRDAGLGPARLKHEWAEIALVAPPAELSGIGVTVVDGPFFSCMPFPSENAYSLTHVRYTPHVSWTDHDAPVTAPLATGESRARHMIADAARYLPCMQTARHLGSLFETKTVLIKNEKDDGRPILFHRNPPDSRVVSVLGGKLDNVYDLFELVRQTPDIAGRAGDAA